ncbi:MAG: bifunctional oligoribonuclease/PAP phosphatase NrnA [Acholeplasmatales bacterium]|nr:bifunctional oligoribonuclease/PAP phosphatase NrnA [Acholeplasmatales bacterium]
MEYILNKIKDYNKIIIFGHERPDGDCIGSQFGLYYIIKETYPNKEVYITGETSDYVSFIGKPILIDDSLFANSLGICVDCANGDRLSDQRYKNCDYTIKIDHHPNVDSFCDYEYVDTKSPACAQILTEFYLNFKDELKMNTKAAEALYVGILTDTGRFKYDSTTSKTHRMAAELLDFGVNIGKIDNELSVETIESLKLRGYCLNTFKVTEHGFAYLIMTRDVIEKFGVSDEAAANQVTAISTIEGCPMWAMFIEYPDQIRIRLRSRGPVVNILAEEYSGGGHPKASGAKLPSWDKLDEFLDKADKLVLEYKKSI